MEWSDSGDGASVAGAPAGAAGALASGPGATPKVSTAPPPVLQRQPQSSWATAPPGLAVADSGDGGSASGAPAAAAGALAAGSGASSKVSKFKAPPLAIQRQTRSPWATAPPAVDSGDGGSAAGAPAAAAGALAARSGVPAPPPARPLPGVVCSPPPPSGRTWAEYVESEADGLASWYDDGTTGATGSTVPAAAATQIAAQSFTMADPDFS